MGPFVSGAAASWIIKSDERRAHLGRLRFRPAGQASTRRDYPEPWNKSGRRTDSFGLLRSAGSNRGQSGEKWPPPASLDKLPAGSIRAALGKG